MDREALIAKNRVMYWQSLSTAKSVTGYASRVYSHYFSCRWLSVIVSHHSQFGHSSFTTVRFPPPVLLLALTHLYTNGSVESVVVDDDGDDVDVPTLVGYKRRGRECFNAKCRIMRFFCKQRRKKRTATAAPFNHHLPPKFCSGFLHANLSLPVAKPRR